MTVTYPGGYGTRLETMAQMRARHEPHMHPAYARRLFAWLESKGGEIGIGGGFRPLGTQPNRPGFAPEGKSFHQPQDWPDAPGHYAAVDLVVRNLGRVHRAPMWNEVPHRGDAETLLWGLHCNIYPSETWHMQPVEISGWQSWVNRGRPGLNAAYPIPGATSPLPPQPEIPNPEEDDMAATVFRVNDGDRAQFAVVGGMARWITSGDERRRLDFLGQTKPGIIDCDRSLFADFVLVGPEPDYRDLPGPYTTAADFGAWA